MIFFKDLDYICLLSFYISKQSRMKVCIQTWNPLQPNLNVLTKLNFFFFDNIALAVIVFFFFFYSISIFSFLFNVSYYYDIKFNYKQI